MAPWFRLAEDARQTVSCHPKKSRSGKKHREKRAEFRGAAALPHFLPRIFFFVAEETPRSGRAREEGVEIMIELNSQYALDGRVASSYRGSFGVPGALRAALFGPIR